MKRLIYILTIITITLLSSTIVSNADATKGQKLFKHKLRKTCQFSGIKFARHYTQSEWKTFYKKGEFPKVTKELCPKLDIKKIKEKWWKDIYDFAYKHGEDSGNVPNC